MSRLINLDFNIFIACKPLAKRLERSKHLRYFKLESILNDLLI